MEYLLCTVKEVALPSAHRYLASLFIGGLLMKDIYVFLFMHFAICLLKMAYAVVNSTSPFLQTTPGRDWIKVGCLDMTDPTQQCPDSWQTFTSPRSSCGKKSSAPCDSLNITTSGASYQTVCGWFRGYQIGTPDAFASTAGLGYNLETYYVDGVSVTYGSPGTEVTCIRMPLALRKRMVKIAVHAQAEFLHLLL